MKKSDELIRIELLIAYVLRYGVLLCLFVIGVGLAARLFLPGAGAANEAVIQALTHGQAPDYHPLVEPAALWQGVAGLQPDAVIALGLVLLIALPVIRVALTTAVFLREKDWAFFGITLFVLCVLLSGILFGKVL